MLAYTITMLALAAAGEANLLTNPDFDDGLSGWYLDPAGVSAEAVKLDDGAAAALHVADSEPVAWPRIGQDHPCEAGEVYELIAMTRGVNARDGYGAYAALEFVDSEGVRIAHVQTAPAAHDGAWTELTTRGICPEGAVRARVALLLNGHGTAQFDHVMLARRGTISQRPVEGPVTLTVTREVACESVFGMGFEDDGWRYNETNASHGVGPEDYALCEKRLAFLNPSWVRMFFWWHDFNPSHDWTTFTWDSDNMRSRYRSLDVYQRLGTAVTVTGVEWNMQDPFAHGPAMARAVGELLEHLIKEKGYTCIKHWILTNEPNLHFTHGSATFEDFVKIHRLVKEEIDRRGLDVQIIGSDDTNGGLPWFRACVENETYFDTVDLFSSHRYLDGTSRELQRYVFEDRLALLKGRKPLVMAEFGFSDQRSTVSANPVMEEYPYALWALQFAIEGFNRGVAGFSIWSVHEMYYPMDTFMNYALWNYKDRDWAIRPVYHAWAMLTREARPGESVYRTETSHPGSVLGTTVGDTLFWLNATETKATVRLEGATPETVRVMTEEDLSGDDLCGDVIPLTSPVFEAPARSFGYAALGGR